MDRFGAVAAAVSTALRNGTVGATVGTADVYWAYAFRGATPPYVVHTMSAEHPEYSSSSESVKTVWSVLAASNQPWPDEASRIAGLIDQDLHDSTVSVSGGTVLRCRRRSSIPPYRDEAQYWYAGAQYDIEFVRALGG